MTPIRRLWWRRGATRRSSAERFAVIGGVAGAALLAASIVTSAAARDRLTEPFLQNPTADSVSVVWFTEALGRAHEVRVGPAQRRIQATSREIEGLYEDGRSHLPGQPGDGSLITLPRERPVWRHEARVDGLVQGRRLSYSVADIGHDGATRLSAVYSLASAPSPGAPLQILLTSDHQAFPMASANIRKVGEVAPDLDAVFFAGDLVNVPGRASEWFDDARGASFFDVLQGRAAYALERETPNGMRSIVYGGAPILQRAPIFPAIGNHEVMGRRTPSLGLNAQFNDPQPRRQAERVYLLVEELVNPLNDPQLRARWIDDASFSTRAYRDIFTLPEDGPGGERYYFKRFGDVALVSLFATRIWRSPRGGPDVRGRHQERQGALMHPDQWGGGAFIFEPIARGSAQFSWLERVVRSPEFRDAPIKLVMLHHPPRGLGGNVTPPFTPPRREIVRDADGAPSVVRYRYPASDDALVNDLEPLLIDAGVDLVLFGHSHIWQRFEIEGGPHYLESSNVGNNYGCFIGERRRPDAVFDGENHTASGDPGGLTPSPPSFFAPQTDAAGNPSPCVASNTLTVFSILDTERRVVESYVFDTAEPDAPARLFDRFSLD